MLGHLVQLEEFTPLEETSPPALLTAKANVENDLFANDSAAVTQAQTNQARGAFAAITSHASPDQQREAGAAGLALPIPNR